MPLNNIDGTTNNDLLKGTLLDDLINAGKGDDTINAAAGNDIIYAGEGNDSVHGAKGNDTIYGGIGNDFVQGGDGSDILNGNDGDDTILGGIDADEINGGADNDLLLSGAGNDTVLASSGNDTIDGGAGNDLIQGNSGENVLIGGQGDDTIIGGIDNDLIYGDNYIKGTKVILGENLVINGSFEDNSVDQGRWAIFESIPGWTTTIGNGIEIQELSNYFGAAADGNAWVELDSSSNSGMIQEIGTESGQEYQISFEYSPRPGVNAESNTIEVYWNNELIDTISKGGGDTNTWKTHTYIVQANNGDTTGLEFRAAGHDECLGGFIDDVKVQQVIDEPLLEFGTNDTFGHDEIDGGAGNDTIFGNQGNDSIHGGLGDDSIRANAGDDVLKGNEGNDFIDGQSGNDTVLGGSGDDYLKGGNGNDLVKAGHGNDGIWGGAGNDSLYGEEGNDLIDDTRGGNDCLFGGKGDDTLYAGDDEDIIGGGDGNDKLFGDKGNDIVVGGAGNDTVNGGQGNDVLYGDNVSDSSVTTLGQNLVVNGSFEDNSVDQGRWAIFTSIPGWTTTFGNGIEIQELTNYFGAAADGNAWVELDSSSNSGMIQNIDTIAEKQYQISFEYSPRPGVSANSNTIEVYWNNELIDTIAQTGGSRNQWQTFSYTVNANSNSTGLEFRAAGHDECLGGFIDDVWVQQVIKSDLPDKIGQQQVTGNDRINGGDGNDTVYGGAGFDTVFGGSGDDILNGTDGTNVGFNQEDRLNGGIGKDTFVLGDSNRGYYNSQGWTDCVVIEDFNFNDDTVQLHGSSNNYYLGSYNGNSYLWQQNGNGWEGVAMFENVQLDNNDLTTGAFEYV